MIVKRISVEVSRTVNLGNYESIRFQAGLEADLQEGEDLDSAFGDAWLKVLEEVIDKVETIAEDLKEQNKSPRLRSR